MAELERFIVGQGESGRMYITHTHAPRFVAELFDDGEAGWPDGLSLSLPESGEVLANFAWIDDPTNCDMRALRLAVADFLEESDFRADRDVDAHLRAQEDRGDD